MDMRLQNFQFGDVITSYHGETSPTVDQVIMIICGTSHVYTFPA